MTDRANRKTMTAVVISNKMDKTVVVETERLFRHPLYQKAVKVNKKFKAHDEDNKCKIGDTVEVTETRPISKDKKWRVSNILITEGTK